jgi:small subunit ribosomal protein S21
MFKIQYSIYRGEAKRVTEVRVQKNEPFDKALRRFRKKCQESGVISELKKREHYEKPSVKKKRKLKAAIRKERKRNMANRG